jgi:hypothetical protein
MCSCSTNQRRQDQVDQPDRTTATVVPLSGTAIADEHDPAANADYVTEGPRREQLHVLEHDRGIGHGPAN